MKIVLTATGGGHLEQIKQLKDLGKDNEVRFLVAKNSVNDSLQGCDFLPEYRTEKKLARIFDLIKIFISSYKYLKKFRPDAVISTGAGMTYPICWLQKKIFKKKVIYIESFARRTSASKTGKRVYKFADYFVVQWESMLEVYPNAIYGGMIY